MNKNDENSPQSCLFLWLHINISISFLSVLLDILCQYEQIYVCSYFCSSSASYSFLSQNILTRFPHQFTERVSSRPAAAW